MHFLYLETLITCKISLIEDLNSVIQINMMRLTYVFFSPKKSLKTFLRNLQLEIRITNGPNIDDPLIAQTKGKVLSKFPDNLDVGNALMEQFHMAMFDSLRSEVCSLTLVSGLSFDKIIPSKKIDANLNKCFDAYIPDDHFMTPDPFPPQ